MKQVFILIIGHNSSGKTTVAQKLVKRFGLSRVSGDDFRRFLYEHIAFFQGHNNSYPTDKNIILRPLVNDYRVRLTHALLAANQSLVFDGSGFIREIRDKYLHQIKADFPQVTTVIIWTDISEPELLKRLNERDKQPGSRWTDMYYDHRKGVFQPPTDDEVDLVLRYDQNNYAEIESAIEKLIS